MSVLYDCFVLYAVCYYMLVWCCYNAYFVSVMGNAVDNRFLITDLVHKDTIKETILPVSDDSDVHKNINTI